MNYHDIKLENSVQEDKIPKKPSFWTKLLETVLGITLALLLTFIMHEFIIQPFQVPTDSMKPTITGGDYILVEKYGKYFNRQYTKGNVIAFKNEDLYDVTMIKRIIAEEGDTVEIKNGNVYINGFILEETYTTGETETIPGGIAFPLTVPNNCLLVMGDNREDSQDSRFFGYINRNDILGKVFFCYAPINSIGVIK